MNGVRTVDLALYADVLAVKAAGLAAELERARDGLRRAAVEGEVRSALEPPTVARLERIGALTRCDARRLRAEVVDLAADLAALRELQAWTEARLADARGQTRRAEGDSGASFGDELPVSTARSRAAG